jgi:D-alanyl-D-alanine carboxypeptidase
MKATTIQSKIESSFRKQVQSDPKTRNAYLLVQSDKRKVDLNIAEGRSGKIPANPKQPNHLASVGKLFTATLISILYEQEQLDFDDRIGKYLDAALMDKLHVYKGQEYSDEIRIKHLLKQTSGLNDVFYDLLKKMLEDPTFQISPREAVIWGKENLKPVAPPGKKHFYTDTNYYLLGLIVENITGQPFHEVMHERIFKPLGMRHAYLHGFSTPEQESDYPTAGLYFEDTDLRSIEGVHQIDYAGGSVTAPLGDFLIFMKALLNATIIKRETLDIMLHDDVKMGFPMVGFDYGYAIWKTKTIPVLMPKKYACWGGVGATGAFMFYHPATESYIIGTFNDFSYRAKALQFMIKKVIKELLQ